MVSPVVHGKISGVFVSEALKLLLGSAPSDWIFVVRCIDSARSLQDVAKALVFHGVQHHILHGNVVLNQKDAESALAADVFTGFDEIWAFSASPPSEDLADLPSATSETTDFADRMPRELVEALARTHCLLIIGDGCGLNYATANEQLGEKLVNDLA